MVTTSWDHPDTARYYDVFNARHRRYRDANENLAAHAALGPGLRVLDLAAGTGLTAEAALPYLGSSGSIVCFEPAEAMRITGARRFSSPQITWRSAWPEGKFDRVLCGAAAWQMLPLAEFMARVRSSLQQGGCFGFNIPSLYMGEADEPGGGPDPVLLQLPTLLAAGRAPAAEPQPPPPSAGESDAMLASAGFDSVRWSHRQRFTQAAYRDWLKFPVLTNALLGECDAPERARRIDAAFERVAPESWR